MRLIICLLTLCSFTTQLLAGGIKGYVRDTNGDILEYATIYIDELGSGTVTNIDGYYEFRMLPGEYRVVFQHLGYETVVERVSIGQGMKELNIRLSPQTFQLDQVEIIDGGEDPAYTVMRKAIAKADFHRQQVDHYTAQVYIKGSGRLLGTPGIARRLLAKEGIKADSSMAFTSESVSEIEYERPNTFREKVISVYTQGDDSGSSPNSYIYGSFYEQEIAQAISPLSTKAFAYYRFELAGYFNDRGYNINKIKVTPRSRGDNVFEGYIYIIEDLWGIHSLELEVYKLGFRFGIKQMYAPIEEQIWLPVSHSFLVDGKVFGFAVEFKYLAAVSDYVIRVNPDLNYDFTVIDEKIEREQAKVAEARQSEGNQLGSLEEKLNSGEELTRKDLRQMMREYEKEELADTEEPEVVSNHTFEVDSLATKRDSAYWAVIRPIPLTPAEVKGYVVSDSLAVVAKVEAEAEANGVKKSNQNNDGRSIFDLITGASWKLGEGRYLHYDGLHNAGFNPVEGYWLETRLRLTQNIGDNRFRAKLTPRYGLAWKQLLERVDVDYRFGPKQSPNTIALHQGRYVSQYNEPSSVNQLFNTFYALLREQNYVQLYRKDYLGLSWQKKWQSSSSLKSSLEWAERESQENNSSQSWISSDSRSYLPAIPFIKEAPLLPVLSERAATLAVEYMLAPWQKYQIKNGDRSPIAESSPQFTLHYRGGFPDINKSISDYQRLGLTYRHTIRPGARGKIDLKVDMGLFLTDNYVGLADYRHFEGNRMIFTSADPVGAFRLLPYYQFSTKDRWLSGHAHYQFRKFLLTQIWEIQMTGAKENFFVNYLNTPTSEHYTEVGYGIDNIFRFLRIEGIAAFRDGKYYDWGIRIGVASNIFGGFGSVEVGED